MNTNSTQFCDFTVFQFKSASTFIHVKLSDDESFYSSLFDYFFDEERLLSYIQNISSVDFKPTKNDYIVLNRALYRFIDEYNKSVGKALNDSEEIAESRNDKLGKIGEYLLSIILSEYYKFNCIIPKLNLVTDNNMSVYGIDTLFYHPDARMLVFGESKVCKKLEYGITQIKKSLLTYEKQIKEEYILVLSNRFMNKHKEFELEFGDVMDECMTIAEFIKRGNINKIGIPLFIAHGTEIKPEIILNRLQGFDTKSLFGIETVYFIISLPVFSKENMAKYFTKALAKRMRTV